MNLAGYLAHTPRGDIGSRGTGYTYILARNGLFLEAENPLLRAKVLLAPAEQMDNDHVRVRRVGTKG